MKNTCHLCGEPIAEHDFYMEYPGGKVCSTCLAGASAPEKGMGRLFEEKDDTRTMEPNFAIVEEAAQAAMIC